MEEAALLYPWATYWPLFVYFGGGIVSLLTLDLFVFQRRPHAIRAREALLWTFFWVSLALIFCALLYIFAQSNLAERGYANASALARRLCYEYLSGFVLEKALAVDNLFVFLLIFKQLHTPAEEQHRILFFGLLGALVLRALFIALGSYAMQFQPLLILAGAFLFYMGLHAMRADDSDKAPGLVRRMLERTKQMSGRKRFFLTVATVEFADLIFAIDSVPAIFGITHEPLIVYTSNIFAMLGLRSLYFLLASALQHFTGLRYALGPILMFVGLKMLVLDNYFGGHFPASWSLAFICGTLGLGILISVIKK